MNVDDIIDVLEHCATVHDYYRLNHLPPEARRELAELLAEWARRWLPPTDRDD